MDYDWLYERLRPYYCTDNGRPGTDPVVLIKMVLIQHLFGIASLRQTYRDIQVNIAYRWFLGYNLLDEIPYFATVSYACCKRFPSELSEEIFAHILNKALNNRMIDTSMIFIDGTHIKASANKKKFQKEQVVKRQDHVGGVYCLAERILRRLCFSLERLLTFCIAALYTLVLKTMIRFSEYAKRPAENWLGVLWQERRISRLNHLWIIPCRRIGSSTDAFSPPLIPRCPGYAGSYGSPHRCGSECIGDDSDLFPAFFAG